MDEDGAVEFFREDINGGLGGLAKVLDLRLKFAHRLWDAHDSPAHALRGLLPEGRAAPQIQHGGRRGALEAGGHAPLPPVGLGVALPQGVRRVPLELGGVRRPQPEIGGRYLTNPSTPC